MKVYSKEEFVAWCREQGNRPFNGADETNCAMTQFGQAMDPSIKGSGLHSSHPIAPLHDEDQTRVARIDLTYNEACDTVNSDTFAKIVKVLS